MKISLKSIGREDLHDFWCWNLRYVKRFYHRWYHDHLTTHAGYLAYVTLLSLVPLLAVAASVFSAFPVFENVRVQIENFVFNNFVPASGDVVRQHLAEFAENTKRMTAIGITSLMAIALLQIHAIDETLNKIWRCHKKRRLMISFSIYWMVLTLGPLLVGSSIAVTSYLVSLNVITNTGLSDLVSLLFRLLPFLLSVVAFLLLYTVVPNRYVRLNHALIGALSAALLFELSKKGFAIYVTQFPSYQAIYGALATIPILFVWIYLSWLVVLIGAEITATVQEVSEEEDELNDLEESVPSEDSHVIEGKSLTSEKPKE